MIFGEIALDVDGLPDWDRLPNSSLFEAGNRFRLYGEPNSRNLHIFARGNGIVVLSGRMFDPVSTASGDTIPEPVVQDLAAGRMNGIQLSGVLVSFAFQGDGLTACLVTDKYGLRPLYYACEDGRLIFATKLAGIDILRDDRTWRIAGDALFYYYHFGFTPNDRTMLDGVRKVPPGSTLTVDRHGKIIIESYFHLANLYRPQELRSISEAEICRLIDERLGKAVKRRTPKNRKVAIAVSGGLDSGYLAQKLKSTGAHVTGYTLGYKGDYDEFQRVDWLSKDLDLDVRKIVLAPEDVFSAYQAASAAASEPIAFNNGAMRAVAVAAQRDEIDTLFDGDGADRLFLGMNRHLQYKKLFDVFKALERLGLTSLALFGVDHWKHPEAAKASILFRNWRNGLCPYPERDLSSTRRFDREHETLLYALAVRSHAAGFREAFGRFELGRFFTYMSISMCPEMFFHTPVEVQDELGLFAMPAFWDDEVVSLAISLPTRWKLRAGKTKYILRKAAAQHLSSDYSVLPKIGLQSSLAFVMRTTIGQEWKQAVLRDVEKTEEYALLAERLPGRWVNAEKLLPWLLWKRLHEKRALAGGVTS